MLQMRMVEHASPSPSPINAKYLALCGLVVFAACLFVYRSTWTAPFVFDDEDAVLNNHTIRGEPSLLSILSPPRQSGAGGRPVANLSFALSYALSGTKPWGYHVLNFAIHVATGAFVFGFLRRTLRTTYQGELADGLALGISSIWLLHPIQTESVTYISQRTECLAGCCYAATLYFSVRAIEDAASRLFAVAAVVAAGAGMMSKELMVTVPLTTFLIDGWFYSGSLKAAWQRHRTLHLALACTWVFLGLSLFDLGQRNVGFNQGISPVRYALIESKGIFVYLGQTLWPTHLVFDYGTLKSVPTAPLIWTFLGCIALITVLLIGIWRKAKCAQIGAFFFLILAPSSSVVPVALQPIAEHRMYLASAVVILLLVLCLKETLGPKVAISFTVVAAICCAILTSSRNQIYADPVLLWKDTAMRAPTNARAVTNWGAALAATGHPKEATLVLQQALAIDSLRYQTHNALGNLLYDQGRYTEAAAEFEQAARRAPEKAELFANWGNALLNDGRVADAINAYQHALELAPQAANLHHSLGCALMVAGDVTKAVQAFSAAVKRDPNFQPAKDALARIAAESKSQSDASFSPSAVPETADPKEQKKF